MRRLPEGCLVKFQIVYGTVCMSTKPETKRRKERRVIIMITFANFRFCTHHTAVSCVELNPKCAQINSAFDQARVN